MTKYIPRKVAEAALRARKRRLVERIRAELPAAVAAHHPFRDEAHVREVWERELDRIIGEVGAEFDEALREYEVEGEA